MMQKKIVTIILSVLIVGLFFRLVTGEDSVVYIYSYQKKIAQLEESISMQRQRNDRLLRITQSLKNDLDMVETIARRDMGMVAPNEVFFVEK